MAPMGPNEKRRVSWSDYGCDLGMSRSCKKTRLNHDNAMSTPFLFCKEDTLGDAKRDVALPDADYKKFLKLLNVDDESEGEEENVIDPDYKKFLDHLKADEKSYIYEMKKEDGKSIFIKYEMWDESFNVTEERKIPAHNISSQGKRGSVLIDIVDPEPSSTADNRPFSPDLKHGTELSLVDKSYAIFLSNLRQNEDSMILEYGDIVVRYESEDESGIDLEVEPECAPYCSREKFLQSPRSDSLDSYMDEDDCDCIQGLSASELSQYRVKLIRLLRKPYSKQEYRDLEDLACVKKPVMKSRQLRRRLVSYPTDESGFSYFDYYDDFKLEFDKVHHSNSIRLNLLRGFFYYMENLSHAESFKPWKDSYCLKIEPGSK